MSGVAFIGAHRPHIRPGLRDGSVRDTVVLIDDGGEYRPGPRQILVRLHDRKTGHLVWEGLADAMGNYHAVGLQRGRAYIPVGIDLSGAYACVASGPVIAERLDD